MELGKIIGVALVVVVAVMAVSYANDPENPPLITPSHTVVCDVTLENFPGLATNIKSYSCYSTNACYMEPFMSLNPWDYIPKWEDRGVMEVTIGTRTATTDYVVYESFTETFTYAVSKCVPDGSHNAIVRLLEDNLVIDSEEFTLEVP